MAMPTIEQLNGNKGAGLRSIGVPNGWTAVGVDVARTKPSLISPGGEEIPVNGPDGKPVPGAKMYEVTVQGPNGGVNKITLRDESDGAWSVTAIDGDYKDTPPTTTQRAPVSLRSQQDGKVYKYDVQPDGSLKEIGLDPDQSNPNAYTNLVDLMGDDGKVHKFGLKPDGKKDDLGISGDGNGANNPNAYTSLTDLEGPDGKAHTYGVKKDGTLKDLGLTPNAPAKFASFIEGQGDDGTTHNFGVTRDGDKVDLGKKGSASAVVSASPAENVYSVGPDGKVVATIQSGKPTGAQMTPDTTSAKIPVLTQDAQGNPTVAWVDNVNQIQVDQAFLGVYDSLKPYIGEGPGKVSMAQAKDMLSIAHDKLALDLEQARNNETERSNKVTEAETEREHNVTHAQAILDRRSSAAQNIGQTATNQMIDIAKGARHMAGITVTPWQNAMAMATDLAGGQDAVDGATKFLQDAKNAYSNVVSAGNVQTREDAQAAKDRLVAAQRLVAGDTTTFNGNAATVNGHTAGQQNPQATGDPYANSASTHPFTPPQVNPQAAGDPYANSASTHPYVKPALVDPSLQPITLTGPRFRGAYLG